MKRFIAFILVYALVLLVGCSDKNVIFSDNTYVVTKGENGVNVETIASYIPLVHNIVKEDIDTSNMPCLTVLKYHDDMLTVSSYNYDRDAEKKFKEWKLIAADNITFNSVTVVDDNGKITVDNITIPQEEYEFIGEYYTYGYFEFNQKGEVTHITFYGETVIKG